MTKILAILLLLSLVVGCGKSEQEVSDATAQRNASLSACPDCGEKVSKRASQCPHCGAPLEQAKAKRNKTSLSFMGADSAVEPVSGVVTYNGQALENADVTFHPVANNERGMQSRASSAKTDAEGRFIIITPFQDGSDVLRLEGAPAGSYKVTVTKIKQKQYAAVDGPPPEDSENNAGPSGDYMAEMGQMNEDGSGGAPVQEHLIHEVFHLNYTTPLKNVEVMEGRNVFKIELKEDGTGTVSAG
jgi:hypothetical protein